MFLTQEKALKRIYQERARGDLRRALQRALEALEKWPQDSEIALEAIGLALETSDFKAAVALMKSALRNHPQSRGRILELAREALRHTFNPLLASFAVESLLRGRDIDAAREILRLGPGNYLAEMINRSQTRSSGPERQERSESLLENELLLGVLLIEAGRFDEAVEPLGRVLAGSPENARLFGSLIIEIERERPQSAEVQFYLGLASMLLAHPDKAETRFFRALELDSAPAERIVELLDAAGDGFSAPNRLLLRGEALIEAGHIREGIELIRRHLPGGLGGASDLSSAGTQAATADQSAPALAALARLERLISRHADIELTLLYAETAAGQGRAREAAAALESCHERDPACGPRLAAWIEDNAAMAASAPAQVFLVRLLLIEGARERAAQAARRAVEIDPAAGHTLLKIFASEPSAETGGDLDLSAARAGGDPALSAMRAELLARAGDGEHACEIIRSLGADGTLDGGELLRLSQEVLRHAGLNLDTLSAAIELAIRGDRIEHVLPFALEFYRRDPDARAELASRTAACAGQVPQGWKQVARLCDLLAEQEQLDRPLRLLQAQAHLQAGDIERAVFEFDQLIMYDENLRCDLIELYERAAADHALNTTLRLALYQLHFEEEHFAAAAHNLARALESDPVQIRDVMPRFEQIAKRDPGNRAVWEEMLGAALRISHIDLARKILARALETLPATEAATLHIYGAKISRAEGRDEEALRCLAKTLESPQANLREAQDELQGLVERDPGSAEARLLLAETLLRLGAEERAANEFKDCLERDPSLRAAVREKLERYLPLSAGPWRINRLLGEIAWAEGRRQDALRLLEAAQKGPPESLAEMAESVAGMSSADPADAQLALICARSLVLAGRGDEAVVLLESLAEADTAHDGRGAEILSELIERRPLHPRANRLLARLLTKRNEKENGLQALLRLAGADEAAARDLVGMIEEFLPSHGKDPRLLVPLAVLRGRAEDFGGALADLRTALQLDPRSRDEILAAASRIEWPALLGSKIRLLEADALIAGGFMRDAFGRLSGLEARSRSEIDALLERLRPIMAGEPAREYYLLAGRLMALGGDIDAAEACLREGAGRLAGRDAIDLLIALGEMLKGAGLAERAAASLGEVLERGGDRENILRRIETVRAEYARSEISRGLALIESQEADAAAALRIAEIALDAEDPAAAERALNVCGRGAAARILRARMHLASRRPLLALAAVRGPAGADRGQQEELELLYIEGLVHERLGDFGRAAAVFSRIAAVDDGYRDCGRRALAAYTNYLSAPDDDHAGVLVAVGDLGPGNGKEEP